MDLREKRIAVIGVGGVGGYLAAMLCKTFPHVSLVARGERGIKIRENGLAMHSDRDGEIKAFPEKVVSCAEELEPQDIIFVCVKNYSLQQACMELTNAVAEHTVIIPVMNGVDPGERVRAYLGKGTVIDSLIYIIAFANPDYSITQQGESVRLRIGIMNADEQEQKQIQLVSEILEQAHVNHKVAEDIECEIWRKYMLNCAYNVLTAYYDNTIGEIRRDPVKAGQYEQLVWEAYHVAKAKNVHVLPEHAETIIRKFWENLADDSTSSLQRDVNAKRPTELETFCGYLVDEAKKQNIQVPVTEKMYAGLREKVVK